MDETSPADNQDFLKVYFFCKCKMKLKFRCLDNKY